MVLTTLDQNITASLKKAGIMPDIVPEDFTSSALLSIKYTKSGEDVAIGNFIKPSDSAEKPIVTFIAPEEEAQYTLLMVDPDAPTRSDPKWGPYRHWVATNVSCSADFRQASELQTYQGPAPPKHTGPHRYIFLLYKQPKTNAAFEPLSKESASWDFKAFVQKNNLELIGVNFFISSNDDN